MNLEELKDKLGIGEDKVYGVMGAFESPDELVDAGRKVREMGYTKLLGKGNITQPLRIIVAQCSEMAASKISQAGGEIVLPKAAEPSKEG